MATQIINNGTSIKIVTNEVPRFILKNQIIEVVVIRDTIIKIDIGLGALYNVFIDQLEVTAPVSSSADDLRDKIVEMLQTAVAIDNVADQKQTECSKEIVNIKNSVNDMKDKVNVLNDKLFFEPKLIDESNANIVYKGYANPGAVSNTAVWAIEKVTNIKGVLSYQWANGSRNFENVWDNRKTLMYS